MRTRRNRQVNVEVNREKDKIWNQIGLSKFKLKLRVKKYNLSRTSNCGNGEKSKTNQNCFKCTQQFLKERTDTDRVENTRQKKFKQTRAQGECLGIRSRRKTWQAAISCGELQISLDPQISECGNTYDEESYIINWIHRLMRGTWGTETSKYPEEEKSNRDFVSSGERKRKRPNQE